jgi:hypothetical protein
VTVRCVRIRFLVDAHPAKRHQGVLKQCRYAVVAHS